MKTLIRLHQILLVLAILSGCYAPELRDCTVTCMGGDECASGQICTKGFCAAEGVTCGPGGNASTDAMPLVTVHVTITGMGKVVLGSAGTCGDVGMPRDCLLSVPRGDVTAIATPLDEAHPFDKWESMTCKDEPATCAFEALGDTTSLQAKFR